MTHLFRNRWCVLICKFGSVERSARARSGSECMTECEFWLNCFGVSAYIIEKLPATTFVQVRVELGKVCWFTSDLF